MADQALVSGMNFVSSAILARMLGVHAFGIFSVFYIVLLYLNSIQIALVINPMMSLVPQMKESSLRRSVIRGMAGYQYLLSALCVIAAGLFALAASLHLLGSRFGGTVWFPFVLTIFFFQCQDWFRRYCYLHDSGTLVFWNDIISYLGQVAVFLVLWKIRCVSVPGAYYAVAVTSCVAFAGGFYSQRIGTTIAETKMAMRRTWEMGRSLLVASQFQWLGSQGILLIVAALIGVSSASGMRAVITLLGPVNVLYQLLDNVVPVRAARAYASGGHPELMRYLHKTAPQLLVAVGLPILLVAVAAKPIMIVAFGKPFEAFARLVIWQCIYTMLALIYRGVSYYCRTLGTTAILARTAFVVSVVTVGSCLILAHVYGTVGAMIALDLGQTFNVLIPLTYAVRHSKDFAVQ